MRVRNLIRLSVVALGVGLIATLYVPLHAPVVADAMYPIVTPDPGGGARYGVPMTEFSSVEYVGNYPGQYPINVTFPEPLSGLSVNPGPVELIGDGIVGDQVSPTECMVGEPYRAVYQGTDSGFGLRMHCQSFGDVRPGNQGQAFSPTGTEDVSCQLKEWAGAGDYTGIEHGGISVTPTVNDPIHPWTTDTVMPGLNYTLYRDCTYINKIVETITYYPFHDATKAFWSWTWSADQSRLGVASAPYTPGLGTCKSLAGVVFNPTFCAGVIPVHVDGSSFAVCANPPPVTLTTWPTDMAATIGFYAKCLFVPTDGWDPGNLVQAKVTTSPIGQAVGSIQPSVLAIASDSGGCGVIIDGTTQPLGHLSVNSCSWIGWAEPIRNIAALGVYIGGGWMVVQFIMSVFSAMLGVRSAQSHIEETGASTFDDRLF